MLRVALSRRVVAVACDRPGRDLLRGRAADGDLYHDVDVTIVVTPAT